MNFHGIIPKACAFHFFLFFHGKREDAPADLQGEGAVVGEGDRVFN